MKAYAPVLAALVAAPSAIEAWTMGGMGPFSLMSPMVSVSPQRSRYYYRLQDNCANKIGRGCNTRISSPRYEITDNEDVFRVALDVPGVKAEDIRISLEDNDQVLSIAGRRETGASDSSRFTARFAQRFFVDQTVDVEKFSASLENGVLVVTAPKDLKRTEMNVRTIPIATPSADEGPSTIAADDEVEAVTKTIDEVDTTESKEEKSELPSEDDVDKGSGGDSIDIDRNDS